MGLMGNGPYELFRRDMQKKRIGHLYIILIAVSITIIHWLIGIEL